MMWVFAYLLGQTIATKWIDKNGDDEKSDQTWVGFAMIFLFFPGMLIMALIEIFQEDV